MNARVKQLREMSLAAVNRISGERAKLVTKFYRSAEVQRLSVPQQRAMAFRYILEHKEICINPGELIVGERGPAPKATPTYPEICLHTMEDLRILNDRPKVSFKADAEVMDLYEREIIPFWKSRTIRERIFSEMSDEWLEAYRAGMFTEFMEQRAPGHTVLGDTIYSRGISDILAEAGQRLASLDFHNDPEAYEKRQELRAMKIAGEAIIMYARRHVEKLKEMAATEEDPVRKDELLQMAAVCTRVPAFAPRSFHEALQYYWFVHVGVVTELNPWDSFNPGRLDQHLYPFYTRGLSDGSLTEEKARELLQAFWVKFNNHPAPPKVGVTAMESNTYTDFALVNLGGVKPDGTDGVNELTYLILDVIEEMRLLQPGSMIQVSQQNPDDFIRRALKIIRTGFGQPSVFNTEAIIQELVRQGKSITDARKGGASGCVESGAFGTEAYILTGYFNLPKVLEVTLNNGIDPVSGKKIGIQTGGVGRFKTFDDLMVAFEMQLNHFISIKIAGNNIISRIYADHMPVPFLSLFIDDCLASGKDYNAGGARYNSSYIQGVGMGSITDSLAAIKYHVFERKNILFPELMTVLKDNFEGHEDLLHDLIYETPKYGNDDASADDIACEVFEMYFRAVDGRPSARGGVHRINLLPTTCHVYFGSMTGAMPDGRKAGEPLSEGISPVQGADIKGPTAVIKSASRLDHLRTGGTLLNQKFSPQLMADEKGRERVKDLIRTYFKLKGHHIQFNVVSADTLREAQKHPEKYRDLIVRVAGYSDYFNDLGEDLQNEIMRRTEHGG